MKLITTILLACLFPITSVLAQDQDQGQEWEMGPAQGSYVITAPDGKIEIPFEIIGQDIHMDASINGKKVRMMIDNGVMWDELLMFGSPVIDELGLNFTGSAGVGNGDENTVQSKLATGITLSFPGVDFIDQSAIVTPYSSGFTQIWNTAEGQVCGTFLKHFVVDIDYDRSIITLIKPEDFVYLGGGVEIPLIKRDYQMFGIPATVQQTDGKIVDLEIALDLGLSGALRLIPGEQSGITVPEKTFYGVLGTGIAGPAMGHTGRVAGLTIGGYTIENLLATFRENVGDSAVTGDSMLGHQWFSRFHVIFDYPNQRMFIEPNSHFYDPFETNMTGLVLRPTQDGNFQIVKVRPDSPASDAEILKDDVVTQINENAFSEYDGDTLTW